MARTATLAAAPRSSPRSVSRIGTPTPPAERGLASEGEYLGAFRAFSSSDLDQVRAYIGTVFKPHTLRAFGKSAGIETIVNHRATEAGSLVYFGYGDVTVEVDPGPLDGFYLLQFACAGSGRMSYGARAVELDPAASAACLSPQRAMRGRFNAGTRMLVARTERARLENHYVRHIGYQPAVPLEFDPQIRTDKAGGAQLAGLVRLLARDDGQTGGRIFSDLQSLLLTTLIYVQPNSWREHLLHAAKAVQPKGVETVQEYVHAHYAEDLSVERLAAAASVSTRTLFLSFERYVGMAPMTYVRDVRLDRARYELRAPNAESVTEVAGRCGFSHLGRFATAYRRKFGEPPSVTRRKP
jgi:AraC-like DNA-binding protein